MSGTLTKGGASSTPPKLPAGAWTHFSHIDMSGYKTLAAGQVVELSWEHAGQDGYDFRAVDVRPGP